MKTNNDWRNAKNVPITDETKMYFHNSHQNLLAKKPYIYHKRFAL